MRILMVCLGNICRSPIAEGVLRQKAKENGLNWVIESAGTESYHIGEAPHKFSQKVCQTHGVDISHFRAAKFTAEDLTRYDIIYAFASDVYDAIERIGGRGADMKKVRYFLNELPGHAADASVPDPYYGNEDGYTTVYELIEETCEHIINKYKNNV